MLQIPTRETCVSNVNIYIFLIDTFEPLSLTKDMCEHQGRSWCSLTGPKLSFKFHRFQQGVMFIFTGWNLQTRCGNKQR